MMPSMKVAGWGISKDTAVIRWGNVLMSFLDKDLMVLEKGWLKDAKSMLI